MLMGGMAAVLAGGLLLIGRQDVPASAECRQTTPALQRMESRDMVLINDRERRLPLRVKVADEPEERLAGFQHLCGEVIASQLILFDFTRPFPARFHMRNVHAPLDIAFLDERGRIVEVQRMVPGTSLYHSSRAVRFALEARSGFFREHDASGNGARLLLH
jgi:uncharacterized membrane protein (UPF0127 family)